MKRYKLINGSEEYIFHAKDLSKVRRIAINIADHSKTVTVKEVK